MHSAIVAGVQKAFGGLQGGAHQFENRGEYFGVEVAFPYFGAVGAAEVETHCGVVRDFVADREMNHIIQSDTLVSIDSAGIDCGLGDGDVFTLAGHRHGYVVCDDISHVLQR